MRPYRSSGSSAAAEDLGRHHSRVKKRDLIKAVRVETARRTLGDVSAPERATDQKTNFIKASP